MGPGYVLIAIGIIVVILGIFPVLDSGIHQPMILHGFWMVVAITFLLSGCEKIKKAQLHEADLKAQQGQVQKK
jgi:hypothetical protein